MSKSSKLRAFVSVFSAGLLAMAASAVCAQGFPSKPVRIVVSDPGGGSDFGARIIAQGISGPLGQPVIIENQGGASGVIAAQTVAKAAPDGYTLLFYANSFWLFPLMQAHVPYDPVKDFSPVTLAVSSAGILVLHPSARVKSVKELVTLAKARPGELNYGSGGGGTASHLAAELFKAAAGVNIVRVPYKGTGPALNDLIGGQIQLMFATATGVMPHVKSGRLIALAVTSAQPSALAPGLPTVAASGLPGYESVSAYGMFAPAKTPLVNINRLNREVVQFLKTPEVREKFLTAGAEVVGGQPEEFAAAIKSDIAQVSKLIRDGAIRVEN